MASGAWDVERVGGGRRGRLTGIILWGMFRRGAETHRSVTGKERCARLQC